MKKVLLTLAIAAMGTGVAGAVANVYTSALKIANGKIEFVLNDNADKVVFNLIKDGNIIESVDLGACVKGANSVAVPTLSSPAGSYSWSLTASAAAVTEITPLTDGSDVNLQVSAGRGVAVDWSPASPAFGNVYAVSPAAPGKQGARTAVGLYAFNAALQAVNADAYTGGMEWLSSSSNPNEVAVAENGQVFISSWADNAQSGVFVAEPTDLAGSWKSVFAESERDSNGLVTIDGVKVHGSVNGLALYGEGDARMLYTTDEDINGTNGDLMVYNIGKLTQPWATAPTYNWGHPDGYVNANQRIQSDRRGGLWCGQYRWQESAANACVYHLNSKGELDFQTGDKSIFLGSTPGGSIACTPDGKLLACLGSDNGLGFVVAKVTFNDEGIPALEKAYEGTFEAPYTGKRPLDADFDAAGNLYVIFNADNEAGGIAAYAIPKDVNEFTTPALDKITLTPSGVADVTAAADEVIEAVYTVTGARVAADLDALDNGVYIVKTNVRTYKIIK